jgi:septal ring factor EnvC (AmiA/AmiB activator)
MKIKEEELNKIKNQQKDLENIIKNVGMLETQKHALLHQLADHNKEIEGTKNELENSYGAININLEDGSYTELSKEDVTKMKVVENVE